MLIYAWTRTEREDLLPEYINGFDDIGGEENQRTELLPTNLLLDR
jgi:hypothetical protein